MNDVIDVKALSADQAQSLKTIGWISYFLHLIVAVAAVVPGAQVGITLLLIALVIDLVKKSDAQGTWQESHFSWRIRSTLWTGVLYLITSPLFLLLYLPGALAWAQATSRVALPNRAAMRHDSADDRVARVVWCR